ncbi:MAG: hypothetical protein IJ612_06835 [Prevotella sp.]|nr:hypothetical protein [Prevotella sp.]
MKKLLLIAAMTVATMASQAQEKLYLSTYNGTNLEKFDGKVCDVTVNRYVFTGWNTIALPFSLTEQELNETFGQNCRLEHLVGAEQQGPVVTLSFQDCKASGLEANTPYILYYTGENGNKKIAKQAVVADRQPALTFDVKNGFGTVTMSGTKTHVEANGLYGILARDNSQAQFVKVNEASNGFYASRCYIQLSGIDNVQLVSRHLAAGEATGIAAVAGQNEVVDVYNTAGVRVATQVSASEAARTLQPGIYVVKGQKIMIK